MTKSSKRGRGKQSNTVKLVAQDISDFRKHARDEQSQLEATAAGKKKARAQAREGEDDDFVDAFGDKRRSQIWKYFKIKLDENKCKEGNLGGNLATDHNHPEPEIAPQNHTVALGFEGGGPYVKTGRDARRKGPKGFLPMKLELSSLSSYTLVGDF
ncbi:hypothetical protein CYMTET_55496 [Cymbomonas tetramitiformis]|uniref:Uncharacterized protein n=1 Tax=Cymbomonas tetramitiformis TaxID=36881 RepID=A0AAE0EMX6_9CHLO|nr:hypothetical protein CYMTET_55496 [Cymbomonas tetramitiformis]